MTRFVLAVVLVAAGLLAGCHEPAHSGVVIRQDQVQGGGRGMAPAVAVRTADGRTSTLAQEVQPIYVVAFVEDGEACCETPYRLRRVAERLRTLNISLVQIQVPAADGRRRDVPCTDCPPPAGNLFRFDDPTGAAWTAFGRPAPGTMLLVGQDRRIDRCTDLCTSDHLVFRAAKLANDYRGRDWRDRLEAPYLE